MPKGKGSEAKNPSGLVESTLPVNNDKPTTQKMVLLRLNEWDPGRYTCLLLENVYQYLVLQVTSTISSQLSRTCQT